MKKSNPLLATALSRHRRYEKIRGGLPLVIGDGYLLATNPLFRVVRDRVKQQKFTFVDSREMHPIFQSMPLMSLNELLRLKQIPFFDNISGLRLLEKRNPRRFLIDDFKIIVPCRNFLLHESAHALANQEFPIFPMKGADREGVFRLILQESFASALETTCVWFSKETPIDKWFFALNSYIGVRAKNLDRVLSAVGLQKTLLLTTIAYLYSNFLYKEMDRKALQRIVEFLELDRAAETKLLKSHAIDPISQFALGLNPYFRIYTTEVYLKNLGFNGNVSKFFKFDPLEYLIRGADFRKGLVKICDFHELGEKNVIVKDET